MIYGAVDYKWMRYAQDTIYMHYCMIYYEQHITQTHHGNGNALSTDLLPILYPIFKIYHRANRTVKRIVRFILSSISSGSTVQNSLDSLW